MKEGNDLDKVVFVVVKKAIEQILIAFYSKYLPGKQKLAEELVSAYNTLGVIQYGHISEQLLSHMYINLAQELLDNQVYWPSRDDVNESLDSNDNQLSKEELSAKIICIFEETVAEIFKFIADALVEKIKIQPYIFCKTEELHRKLIELSPALESEEIMTELLEQGRSSEFSTPSTIRLGNLSPEDTNRQPFSIQNPNVARPNDKFTISVRDERRGELVFRSATR